MDFSSEIERIQGLPVWDEDRRRELEALGSVLGKPNYLKELWSVFEDSWNDLLGEWSAAIQSQDKTKLRALAHRYKGSTGSVGTLKLYEYFALIQKMLDLSDLREAGADMQAVWAACQKAGAVVAEVKASLSGKR